MSMSALPLLSSSADRTLCGQISLLVVGKFDFVGMLDSIVHHRVTQLMYASSCQPFTFSAHITALRIVPPQAVLFCKVRTLPT